MGSILQRDVSYRIDERDVVVWVNDAWRRFAIENGAPRLADEVVGSTLWTHVAGDGVKHLLRSILARVRWQQAELELPFCCDTPDLRRSMVMNIRPLPSSHVEFSSTLIEQRPRPTVAFLDPGARRSRELMLVCSWCNRVNVGEWMEADEAVARLRLFEREDLPRITHGLCGDCEALVRAAAPLRRAG